MSSEKPALLSWDEGKRNTNLRKHGYDFADLAPAFDGRLCIIVEDRRWDYGEERFNMLVEFDRQVINITFTPRGERYHLISARPASRDERTTYHGLAQR
ncbi:MAG TPA: BrnT family toxin [Beijerinckiaceae bacterium]